MQLHFNAISEPSHAGPKWQKLFKTHWPAYQAWLHTKEVVHVPDLETSQAALKRYMPKMWPTYKRLCSLANADEVAARFLTGFQPPAYFGACSQAATTKGSIQLVRNYDYHPDLTEGTQLLSAWNGKKVIATIDWLAGVLDGMNEDGLAVSLTFGGRKEVGTGFGITFILRYVLEFCSNVQEAIEVLISIPSHMSYNVTVVDRSGALKTVFLAPDKAAFVNEAAYTTNHQGVVDWPENAFFNKTIERAAFLENMLRKKRLTPDKVVEAFLQAPLYNTRFAEGFGTLYTAAYRPTEGSVQLHWPNDKILQSFDNFQEQYKLIQYQAPSQELTLAAEIVDSLPANYLEEIQQLKPLHKSLIGPGQVAWETIADYWSNIRAEYRKNRLK
jgi:predicted choloylglycine hydrolase